MIISVAREKNKTKHDMWKGCIVDKNTEVAVLEEGLKTIT